MSASEYRFTNQLLIYILDAFREEQRNDLARRLLAMKCARFQLDGAFETEHVTAGEGRTDFRLVARPADVPFLQVLPQVVYSELFRKLYHIPACSLPRCLRASLLDAL